MKKWLITCLVACLAVFNAHGATPGPQRVVSLGGTVTEIVYQLGKGDVLAGNDLSSIFPPAATSLPRVGYYRDLPLEGLVSLNPDLVLASEQAGPPDVLRRIQELGINVITVSDSGTLDSLYERIRQIAAVLHVPEAGKAMEQNIRDQIASVLDQVQQHNSSATPVRTVMLMQRTHQLQSAGSGTTAAVLLELAGLENVLATQQGYRTLSAENLAALQPELIVTTLASIEAMGGASAFSQTTGISLTPAARNGHILVMDDLLILGLGPRTAQTLYQLTKARRQVMQSR